jgi:hypothetical protein
MKKLILISIIAIIYSCAFSADTLFIPLYKNSIQIPFGTSQADCINYLKTNPRKMTPDKLLFIDYIYLSNDSLKTGLYLNFKNDHLTGAKIIFNKIETPKQYNYYFDVIYKILKNHFNDYNNMYWISYGPVEGLPKNGYKDMTGDVWAHFNYYWDQYNLTYNFTGKHAENGLIFIIKINPFQSRENMGYIYIEKDNFIQWQINN